MSTTVESIVITEDSSDVEKAAQNVRGLDEWLSKTGSFADDAAAGFDKMASAAERAAEAAKDSAPAPSVPALGGGKQAPSLGGKLSAEEQATLAAMQQETKLAAELATFDAERVRRTAALKSELDEKNNAALGIQKNGDGGDGQEETASKTSEAAAALESAGVALAAAAAAAAAAAVVMGAKLAVSAVSTRENIEASFGFLLGSSSAAKELYEKASDVAEETGLAKEDVVAKMKALLQAKFGKDEAIAAVTAAGNLAQVMGQEGADQLLDVLSKAKELGGFSEKMIKSLASAGVSKQDLLGELAKETGKSVADLEAQLKKGTLDADAAATAIENVINAKLGGAGGAAAGNISRLFDALKDRATRLFDQVDIGPVKETITNVLDALKGPAGGALRDAFNTLFGGIAKLFGTKAGDVTAAIEGVAAGIKSIGTFVDKVAPAINGFFSGIAKGAAIPLGVLGDMIDLISSISGGNAEGWKALGDVLGFVAGSIALISAAIGTLAIGPIVAVGAAIGWVFDKLTSIHVDPEQALAAIGGFFSSAYAAITGAVGQFVSAGEQMIAGLVQGIKNGAEAVIDAITGVVGSAIDKAKALLHINSPSKVFQAIGASTGEGMALGIGDKTGLVEDAVRSMGSRAIAAIPANDNAGGASVGGARAGGATTNHFSPTIHVTAHLPPGTTPEQARQITAAATRGAQEEFDRHLLVSLRTIQRAA